MIFRQSVVAIRGDDKDITMNLPTGAGLSTAQSVTFYASSDEAGEDAVWEQAVTPSSDTVATASIGSDEWTEWEAAGSPRVLRFAFRVVNSDGEPHTPVIGTITVVQSAAA